MTAGQLFDPGPGAPADTTEPLSADRRRTNANRAALDAGIHPATRRPLLPVEPAAGRPNCGDCAHAHRYSWHDRSYWKCDQHRLGQSHSAASDIRKGWPACALFETGAAT